VLSRNKIKNKSISLILIITFSFFGLVGFKKPVQAGAWGEAMASELVHEAWIMAKEAFLSAMLTNLKTQANNLLRDRIRVLLTGQGNSLVITDYDDFIYGEAQKKADLYTKDFFRVLGDGVSDATAAMYDDVEDALLSPESEASTIDQYVEGGLDNIFDENSGGGNQAMVAMISNDMNNPFGVYLKGQAIQENQAAQAQNIAKLELEAGEGFASQRDPDNNLINLPGSVLSSITSKIETTYIDMLNMATSIPEVVGLVAANALSKTIEAGVVKVTSPIDNQLKNIHDTYDGGVKELQDEIYGGFGNVD